MSPHETRPTFYIELLRRTFRDLACPGHALSVGEIMSIQRQINSCYEVTREMEQEFEILANVVTPQVRPTEVRRSADVIPLKRRPSFHVVCGSPDGGDAA